MRVTYRQIPPLTVIYARSMGPYRVSCGKAWAMLDRWLDQNGIRQRVKQGYGIFRDDPEATEPVLLRYDACVPLLMDIDAELTEGIGRQTLRGGAYAVHTHVGPYDETGAVFSQLRREIVPKRGLSVDRDRPFFAIYMNDPAMTRAVHRRTELCVPVIPICMPLSSNDDEPATEVTAPVLRLKA